MTAEDPRLVCVAGSSPGDLATAVDAVALRLDATEPERFESLAAGDEPYRLAVVATSPSEAAFGLRQALDAFRAEDRRPRFHPPELAFVCPGQGVQRPGMGLELMGFKCFSDALSSIEAHLPGLRPLASTLASSDLDATEITQPATVALSLALAATYRALGVEATAALGHSVGEIGAAVVAGALPIGPALGLVTTRGQLMARLPEAGAMALVRASEAAVLPLLTPGVELAALNGPASTVIAGPGAAVTRTLQRAADAGLETRVLPISQASHCALLNPMLDAFEAVARELDAVTEAPALALASTLLGGVFGVGGLPERPNAAYWRRQAREPVRFADAVRALAERGMAVFVELAPTPGLARLGPTLTPHATWLTALSADAPGPEYFVRQCAKLFELGARIDATLL